MVLVAVVQVESGECKNTRKRKQTNSFDSSLLTAVMMEAMGRMRPDSSGSEFHKRIQGDQSKNSSLVFNLTSEVQSIGSPSAHDLKSPLREDRKLFHTSTTEISEGKIRRTPSNLSGSTGSHRWSQSSLSSNVGTSTGTIGSRSSNNAFPLYSSSHDCHPSTSRASMSTSSSSVDWGKNAVANSSSCKMSSTSSVTSDLIKFDEAETTKVLPHVSLRKSRSKSKKSAFSEAAMMRASCPTLNNADSPIGHRSAVLRDDVGVSSVSTMNIGPSSKHAAPLATSKSSGCLALLQMRSLHDKSRRPITLRFAPSGLTETNRVMWMSETGDHAGTVRWIGKIRDEFYAGVEFDKQIGNSSGIYGYGYGLQIRLFTCKLGHGRFIPINQLILYDDFYEDQKTGFICIICRDDFIEPGQSSDLKAQEKIMVATKCGHLFHQTCLNQWFNEKAAVIKQCPYCQFPMERHDTIRIFPAQLK